MSHKSDNYDYLFKILLIGNSGVGKSSIVQMYSEKQFSENFLSTIGVDFKVKTVTVDDKIVKMQIWDTAGQERFRSITNSYYRGAHGIFIVYDVTNRKSFNDVHTIWKQEVERHTLTKFMHSFLVGNKTDLYNSREVSYDEGQRYADEYSMSFIEVSAKSNSFISDAFAEMAVKLKDKLLTGGILASEKLKIAPGMNIETMGQKNKKSCC
jgi:Ras-related protein Rab-1A